jgi:hypothetical protein
MDFKILLTLCDALLIQISNVGCSKRHLDMFLSSLVGHRNRCTLGILSALCLPGECHSAIRLLWRYAFLFLGVLCFTRASSLAWAKSGLGNQVISAGRQSISFAKVV